MGKETNSYGLPARFYAKYFYAYYLLEVSDGGDLSVTADTWTSDSWQRGIDWGKCPSVTITP